MEYTRIHTTVRHTRHKLLPSSDSFFYYYIFGFFPFFCLSLVGFSVYKYRCTLVHTPRTTKYIVVLKDIYKNNIRIVCASTCSSVCSRYWIESKFVFAILRRSVRSWVRNKGADQNLYLYHGFCCR